MVLSDFHTIFAKLKPNNLPAITLLVRYEQNTRRFTMPLSLPRSLNGLPLSAHVPEDKIESKTLWQNAQNNEQAAGPISLLK